MAGRKGKRKGSGTRPRRSRPTIGLLSEAGGSPYHNALWAGFASAALELDVNLMCYVGGTINAPEYGFDPQRNILYDLVAAEKVDGLLICGTIGNYITTEEFQSLIDRYRPLPMVGITQTPGLPCVIVDNESGMRDIVTHFIEVHGYRRIAFICGPENNAEAVLRYRAYADALAEHDLPLDPDLVTPGAFIYETGMDAIRLLLDERKVKFEAVVAANDWMAFGALKALEDRGICVPGDVALGGFDDTREAAASRPSLTTGRQPTHKLGWAGVEVLLKLLAGEQVPEQTMLPTKLVVRRSCGCSEPAVVRAAVGPLKRRREPLQEAMVARREVVLSEMIQAVEESVSLSPEWAGRLLDAFLEEMASSPTASKPGVGPTAQGPFLSVLDDVLQQALATSSQVDDWQEAISVMRRHILPYLTNVAALSRAEDLFSQGRVAVGRMAQWNWAHQEVEKAQRDQTLSYLSGDLVAAVETEHLLGVVGQRLPQLGFSTFHLSFYDGHERPAEWSRLMLAYDRGKRVEVDAGGRRFATRRLVPDELFPQGRRYTWVLESLNFGENQFGCLILEAGSQEGSIYGTLTRQISGALQNSLLVQRLENRRIQLVTAAEVSRAASGTLDLDELLQQVVDLVRERFGLYYAGLFLIEGEWAMLRAGTGEAGRRMLVDGYKLKVGGDSAVGRCAIDRQAYIALDVTSASSVEPGEKAVGFENPLLPETRSEMALPLISRGEVIGALTVQSSQEAAFDEKDIAAFQTMADQLANAITNAQLYEKAQRAYAEVEQQVLERTAELEQEVAERERAQEENLRLQQEIIEAQQRAIQELSTPIIPVMEGVIVMPLIGSVDTLRAKDVTRSLLAGIRVHKAKVAILDITGVPIVDSGVAAYLNKTIQAARLKGARLIVTGVSDAVAETIVDLGIDWSGIETLSDLHTGLRAVLKASPVSAG
jgi:DNA-binding LacI/PurR family transcriptional regulator/anti-anti-sigma regulatory factor/putative methionine-R-sulfoxide reductase with GAF domain